MECRHRCRYVVRFALATVLMAMFVACDTASDLPEVIAPLKPSTLDREPDPRTLEEALDTLDRASPGTLLIKMRSSDESIADDLHEGLGRWIRNEWGLFDEAPLYRDLERRGLKSPEDMSGLILHSWWRRMHHQPLDIVGQIRASHAPGPSPPPAPGPNAHQ
jgi:hypothetical protein